MTGWPYANVSVTHQRSRPTISPPPTRRPQTITAQHFKEQTTP